MAIDEPRLPPVRPDSIPPSRTRPSDSAPALIEKPRRRLRELFDPFDIKTALARLAQLLDADINGPRLGAPRGFYLDILV